MDAYIYRASLYCTDCAEDIQALLTIDEGCDDSDTYPQGPYPNGGGEADFPQHCDNCGVHLENPLTNDGYTYVREAVATAQEQTVPATTAYHTGVWEQFYQIGG
jgi:hypothetical protein